MTQYSVAVNGPNGHIFFQRFVLEEEDLDSEAMKDEVALATATSLIRAARAERLARCQDQDIYRE